MKNADIVFLLNEETKNNVMEHLRVPCDRIVLVGNGVDTDAYHPLKQDTREKFGMGEKKVILQVGSVNENKGQLRSVQHLLPMLQKNQNLIYAYAGGIVDENYHEQVLTFAKEHDLTEQIRYLGMITPGKVLNELYNTAVATILPSGFESFGLVAIESMAAGVPVLIDQNSPMDFGEGSVRYDAAHFEDAANYLLTENIEELRKAARNNVINHYSWDAVAADYAKAFRNGMK